ncbi:MAG: maleylacetate reductase [Actinobacteria bacterium]|nr:maleylacetate reductase [Actinomycetota bacterium]
MTANQDFRYESLATRVVFGTGAIGGVAQEVERLGTNRALVVSSSSSAGAGGEIEKRLGARCVARFTATGGHVPLESVQRARALAAERRADCVVSIGGGPPIGLAKAMALEGNLKHLAVPTTYSGSEMTPYYAITSGGGKQGGRDDRVRPETVIYDPGLTFELSAGATAGTGMNAIAHCVEALYGPNRNPVSSVLAEEGLRTLAHSLVECVAAPRDTGARTSALCGAHLAGIALAVAGMALHHRICHVLGGSFSVSHGDANALILPYVVAFNADAEPGEMARVADAVGSDDAAGGLYRLARALGTPSSLAEVGIKEEDLDAIAEQLVERKPFNPKPVSTGGVRTILQGAYEGRPPNASNV